MNLLDEAHFSIDPDYHNLIEEQRRILAVDPAFATTGEILPAAFALHFLPHLCRRPFCTMHQVSFQRYHQLCRQTTSPLDRVGRNMALAAPRGSAKSSIHTLILPLLDICLRRELYIVIISATSVQACIRLRNIQRELISNARLNQAFGDALKPQRPWTRTSISVNGVRVDAFGALAEIRGISHGEARPTKIILDDAESSRRALTAPGRLQMQQWYDEIIENLGDSYTHVEVVGTILHRDSLLSRLLERTGFDHARHVSVRQWSAETELWKQWEQLYLDIHDANRDETAAAFLQEHSRKLLDDTEVLWPERESYVDLMKQLATRGRPAFFKEKQNLPLTAEELTFNPASWPWFRMLPNGDILPITDRNERAPAAHPIEKNSATCPAESPGINCHRDLVIYGFLDPALGRDFNKGDFAAIVTVGRHPSGACYVLDVSMHRDHPSEQVQRVLAGHRRLKFSTFWYEGNNSQREHYDLLFNNAVTEARLAGDHAVAGFRFEPHDVKGSKADRIHAMHAQLCGNKVHFNAAIPESFIVQAEEYPGAHDDGLDALASCLDRIENQYKMKGQLSRMHPRNVHPAVTF